MILHLLTAAVLAHVFCLALVALALAFSCEEDPYEPAPIPADNKESRP